MNKEETKNKLISFCEGLHKEGLLTNEELKNCYVAFEKKSYNSSLKKIGNIPSLNNNLKNYGMNEEQSMKLDNILIGNNNIIKCNINIYKTIINDKEESERKKYTLYTSLETNTTAKYLYIKDLEGQDNPENDNYNDKILENIIFKITKTNKNLYTIRNFYTNELIKCQMDKSIKLDGTNQTDNALFKLYQHDKYVRFESYTFPNFFLTGNNPLNLTEGSINSQYWKLDIIDDNNTELIDNDDEYNANYTRQLIKNYITTYELDRAEYNLQVAKLKYLEILKKKILNIVKKNGIISNYLRSRIRNKEINITENQMRNLEANIYSEVKNNEIVMINDNIDQINIMLKNSNSKMNNKITELLEINKLIDDAIEEKKTELTSLNQLLDKVNNETKNLNSKFTLLNNNINTKTEINEKSTINNSIIDKQYNQEIINYRLIIIIFVITVIGIIFLSFKLLAKIKKEL
jgi:hypothetical protein